MTARDWRLLVTEATDGATNMAIDEALWLGRQRGDGGPTIRFFAWDPPTVSLGYGQALDDHVDVAACRASGVGLVRRPTGGSAIYHDGPERELTYTVVATNDDLGVTTDLLEAYRWIARALARGLQALGAPVEIIGGPRGKGQAPAFCFARTGRYEIEVGGRKLVGSAQRRRGAAFLQHGSVPLSPDPWARGAVSLAELIPTPPAPEAVATALREGISIALGATLERGSLRKDERTLADTLERERYRAPN